MKLAKGKLNQKETSRVANLLGQGFSIRKTAQLVKRDTKAVERVKKQYPELIQATVDRINQRVMEEMEPSLNTITELRDNGESEIVRLKSAEAILKIGSNHLGKPAQHRTQIVFNISERDDEVIDVSKAKDAEVSQ